MNSYGYKVCYKRQGKEQLKIYIVTNTYDLALFHVRWYESHSPPDESLIGVTWVILPITKFKEYQKLWKDCPFTP